MNEKQKSKCTLGVDLGGTKVSAGVVDIRWKIVVEVIALSTESWKSPEKIVDNIKRATDLCLRKSRISLKNITGIGVGIPTVMKSSGAALASSDNLPTMSGFNLKSRLLDCYPDKNIVIENDANCFVLGETLYGNARNHRFCCGITLGTGVGMGLILNGEIYHGSQGWAGEIWHSPYQEYENIEGIISGKGLSLHYEELAGLRIGADLIQEKARQGDKKAKEVWKIFGEALGYVLCYVVNILNPEIIVIGGSISQAYDSFIDFVENILEKYTKSYSQLRVVRAKHIKSSGIIGASVLARQKIGR